MKKKIINGLLFAVALVAATSSFVSCKDYEGDNYAELNEKYTTLQAAYLAQVAAMQDYVLTSKYEGEVGANYDKSKGTIQARLNALEKDTASLADRILKNNQAITYATALAKADSARSWNDSIRIDKLQNAMQKAWGDDLEDAMMKAAKVAATVAKDSDKWNKAVEVADSAWNWIKSGKDAKDLEYKNLAEMIEDFKEADKALQDQIDALREDVDKILESIKKEVTGIEIQGTINPIYGTFAYPVGMKSYVLATYYGEIDAPVFFPAGDTDGDADFWVGGVAGVLTSELKDIKAPGFGGPAAFKQNKGIVMDETVGNAGTLYVTVNPSNVDFTGKEFTLRSSDNKISKVVLSDLVATDDVLTWGARRASANGFYKATATISKDVVKDVALSFKFDALKTEVKGILDNFTSISAREAVVDIAKLGLAVMNAMPKNVPQLGVQAQWKDDLTGWKNYVSKYELAAVSAKPLGYDFLYDVNYAPKVVKIKDAVTAKERAYEKEIESYINIQLGLPANDPNTNIEVDEANKKIYLVVKNETVGKINPSSWTVGGMPVTGTAVSLPNGDLKLDITPLFDAINGTIAQKTDDIKSKMQSVLNKLIAKQNSIFDKVAGAAGNPNRFILPALLASNESVGYFYPSRNWFSPTEVKAGETIKLYPTTLTGEVVAPAFKKYVAILRGPNASKNYNTGDLNTVLEGSKYNLNQPIEITLTEKGVYEFIYEALGYNGKISGKKYYIEVY